ncbi:ribonuclease HI family protein [Candidatus Woesearchaeota archaeon]|nr:ribonuclease HI family protein [Candidatus Woesearchaeota archaeon]
MVISKILIHADGGSRKNPGAAAIGILVLDEEKNKLEEYKECIGNTTNNVAEYKALIKSLQIAAKYTRDEVHIFMDSELIINQINGLYRIKSQHLFSLFQEVKDCERAFKKVVYNHIPRSNRFQSIADKLVNEALDGI